LQQSPFVYPLDRELVSDYDDQLPLARNPYQLTISRY